MRIATLDIHVSQRILLLRVVTRFSFGHRAFCVANEM